MNVHLPSLSNNFNVIAAHVVDLDVTILLGLDVLTQLKAAVGFVNCLMASKKGSWFVNLARKVGHLFVVWDGKIYFTEPETKELLRHFYHPKDEKLMALINCRAPKHKTQQNRSAVSKVCSACDICNRNGSEPYRFRVSVPSDQCVFNRTIAIDLMFMNNRALIHCVDKEKNFKAAAFSINETAKHT